MAELELAKSFSQTTTVSQLLSSFMIADDELTGPIQDPFGVAEKGGGRSSGKGGGEMLRLPGLSAEAVGAIPRGMGSRRAPRSI